jgi:hypothetical protein
MQTTQGVIDMADVATVVDSWLAALNEPDAGQRRALIERAWADDGRWVDPPFEGAGHAGIGELIGGVQAQCPGARFRRATAIDAHHDAARYGWELRDAGGALVIAGTDVAELADDGRLRRVTGFFGDPAPAAA